METAVKNTTKRYDKYKPSGVEWLGDIPEDWEILPIRAIFEERNEKNDGPKTDFILSVTKDRGVIPYDEKGAIGNNKSEDIERYKVVYKGDFVINKMNVVIGSLGMSKYFGAFSQVYLVYKPKSSKINIKYYSYIFSNPSFYKSLIRYCTGIMELRESLNKDDFKKLILPFPDYKIQSEIVKFLDDKTSKIDQAIAIKKQQIDLLKERRQILIHKAVTKGINPDVKLRDSGVEWIGMIPEHYLKLNVSKVLLNLEQGDSPSITNIDSGFYALKLSAIKEGHYISNQQKPIKGVDYQKRFQINKNDFLVTRGNTPELVGESCIVNKVIPEKVMFSDLVYRLKFDEKSVYLSFMLLCFQSVFFRRQIINSARGSSSTMVKVSQGHIKSWFFFQPPLEEQIEISAYVESCTTKIATAIAIKEQEIEKLKEYKSSLIDGVVTGKVRVC
jgi:type I restriction enzyme S subunit